MKVELYDTLEQAIDALEEARKAADARVQCWQAAVKPGDCIVTEGPDGLVIFGEVLEGYDETRLQHYRFCRCYSVACPEGELGDVHVSTIVRRISRAVFEEARAKGSVLEPFR